MIIDLFKSLPINIFNNFNYLQNDFIGLSIYPSVFLNLLVNSMLALGLIFTSFLLGDKIRKFFFRNEFQSFDFLISIAFGYIFISLGIAILGFFSILSPNALFLYISGVTIISIFPLKRTGKSSRELGKQLKLSILCITSNKFVSYWILLFIILAGVNLINPEIREDQYHVDLPISYLKNQTIMIPPEEAIHVSGSTLLSEMYYLGAIFVGSKETARYIHFLFYLLILITLVNFSKIVSYKFSKYSPLLFASAPVVIKETSSMYVDFQWIFLFLLSILILVQNKKNTNLKVVASGVLTGGMLSTKLWTIVFVPASIMFLLYLIKKTSFRQRTTKIFIFILPMLLISAVWFIRAYILSGNPIYPAFLNETRLENTVETFPLSHYFKINFPLFNPFLYINVFSPLFFLGIFILFFKLKNNLQKILKLNLTKYFLLLFILYTFINYPYGRYLLGLYVLFIFVSSFGLTILFSNFEKSKYIVNLLMVVFFSYYFINSILVLPYALGFTDKNKYLSRILIRDNSSYFDFGERFNKHISKNDFVATYGIYGYYYANFNHIDVNFIFDRKNRSFNLLKKNGVTKLFIKGGDINYFCKIISLTHCKESGYELVSNYLEYPNFYLYNIK